MSKIIKNGVTYGGMPTVSGNISYDNTSSGLNAITVQNAITELKEIYDLPKGYAWAGTQDEWDALSAQEKQIYDDKVVLITDDAPLAAYSETVLFSDGDGTQTTFTLSDSYKNYDEIIIITKTTTDKGTYELTGKFLTSDLVQNVKYGVTGDVWYIYFTINSNTEFARQDHSYIYIYKIIGIKYTGPGGGSGDLTAADVAFSDNTRSASIYAGVTNVDEALMAVKSTVSNFDATDIAFTAPSTSGHSTYGANTDTVQEALNDINNAMRSVIEYGDIGYYVKNMPAQSVTYNACGGFWSGTSVSYVEEGLNYIGEYLNNFSPSANADDIYFSSPLDSIYSSNTDNVQEALEDINTVVQGLDTEDIALPSASKTGIYENADDVQDALDAIKTALASGGGGGGGSVDATNVTFDSDSGCWGGACAGNVDTALRDLDERVKALSGGGGSGASTDASDVTFDYNKGGCWGGSSAEDVETALFDLDERVRNLSADDIPYNSACAGSGFDIFEHTDNVDEALTAIEVFVHDDTDSDGNILSTKVTYTKPQNSIYDSGTDTVAEALDDVSTTIQGLTSLDISFDGDSACFGVQNITNVRSALVSLDDRLKHLPTELSYAKPQSSIYGSNTDTVKEALDDINTVIQALDTTDIAVPSASRTGIYANAATVQQALDAIKTAISSGSGGGSSSASSVSFTKPQGGIYSSGTDTVQEALEDVSTKVSSLAASDIVYVNGCGGKYPTEVETVHDALKCLQHLLLKYSEFEEETGWLWFNDKPIYQISVEEIESGTTNLFDTNELKIDDLVYMEATLTDSGGTKRWTISGSSGDFYWNTATHMIVYGGSDVITTATIRYTKTSD